MQVNLLLCDRWYAAFNGNYTNNSMRALLHLAALQNARVLPLPKPWLW